MPLQYIINSEVYLRLFMNQVVSITKSINSYEDVHQRFNLKRTEKEHLFLEWFENIPELTEYEKAWFLGYKYLSFPGLFAIAVKKTSLT